MTPEGLKNRGRRWGFGNGTANPPHQLGLGVWERCELPSAIRGGSPTSKSFPLFSAFTVATPDAIIVLMCITKHEKILIQFNLESIIVHLALTFQLRFYSAMDRLALLLDVIVVTITACACCFYFCSFSCVTPV